MLLVSLTNALHLQGSSLALVQDLPVSKPYTAGEIDALVAAKDVAALCPWYVDLAPAGARLVGLCERLRALGPAAAVTICKVRK